MRGEPGQVWRHTQKGHVVMEATGLTDLTIGKEQELLRRLAAAGFTTDMVDFLLKLQPDQRYVTQNWVHELQIQMWKQHTDKSGMFTTPQHIYDEFMAEAERQNWSFSDEQLQRLRDQMPVVDEAMSLDRVWVLDIGLGSFAQTFHRLLKWHEAETQFDTSRLGGALRNSDYADWRQDDRSSLDYRGRSDRRLYIEGRSWVRWVQVDLGRSRGAAATTLDGVPVSDYAGLAVLSAAIQHPVWLNRIDGRDVPGVFVTGLMRYNAWSETSIGMGIADSPLGPTWEHVLIGLNKNIRVGTDWITDWDREHMVLPVLVG